MRVPFATGEVRTGVSTPCSLRNMESIMSSAFVPSVILRSGQYFLASFGLSLRLHTSECASGVNVYVCGRAAFHSGTAVAAFGFRAFLPMAGSKQRSILARDAL